MVMLPGIIGMLFVGFAAVLFSACRRQTVRPLKVVRWIPILLLVFFAGRTNFMFRHRWLVGLAAISATFLLVTADAHARAGGGFSAGSRGMRTYSAPPSTPTAPSAAPLQNRIR